MINYAKWQSEAEFCDFVADPQSEHIGAAIKQVGSARGPQATHRRVVAIITPDVGK